MDQGFHIQWRCNFFILLYEGNKKESLMFSFLAKFSKKSINCMFLNHMNGLNFFSKTEQDVGKIKNTQQLHSILSLLTE